MKGFTNLEFNQAGRTRTAISTVIAGERPMLVSTERLENVMRETKTMDGRVIAVRGAVVDVAFDGTTLPPIEDALLVMPDGGTPITVEVQAHLNETTVRSIALQSTSGLSRGALARASGGPIKWYAQN